MVHQQVVAQRDADAVNEQAAVGRIGFAGEAQRKGQGVVGMPADFGNFAAIERVSQRGAAIEGLHPRQTQRVTMGRVGVFRQAGQRAADFLEDQHGADCQVRMVAAQGGGCGTGGQAAAGVAPSVEVEAVVGGVQGQPVHRLEDQRSGLQGVAFVGRIRIDPWRHTGHAGVEADIGRERKRPAPHLQM